MSESHTDQVEKNAFVEESIRILREAYKAKKLVVVVGSGVDTASGVPSRKDAVKQFCSHLQMQYEDGMDTRIPQYYFHARGKKAYTQLSKKIFRYQEPLQPNAFHKRIAELDVHTLITTNYTDLLERELNRQGYPYQTVCKDQDLFCAANGKTLIKMHGDFAHDNFILKEEDYTAYSSDFHLIETFVKSVFAKNVVLFLGFSLRDPDFLQILSWIKAKDCAGENSQQVYFLESEKEESNYESAYFKNFGVHVIYTNHDTRANGDSGIDGADVKGVFAVLDRIQRRDSGEASDLEDARAYLAPFLNLDYILRRYLEKGLSKCGLSIHGDTIWALGQKEKDGQDAYALLEEIAGCLEKDDVDLGNPYDVLAGALRKSGVNRMEWFRPNEERVEARTVIVPHLENQIGSLAMEFDFESLRKLAAYYDFLGRDGQAYAKQAYIYYLLEDFGKTYQAVCKALELFLENKQYVSYYLAQSNRLRIAHIIRSWKLGTDLQKDIYDRIQEETAAVHLESIRSQLSDLPEFAYCDAGILNELDASWLHEPFFQDIYRLVQEMKEQRKLETTDGGSAVFEALRREVKDYYFYLANNMRMTDKYAQAKEVFVFYIKSVLELIGAAGRGGRLVLADAKAANVQACAVSRFELFVMIRCMEKTDLWRTLVQNRIEVLPLEADGLDYVKTVIRHLKSEDQKKHDDTLWKVLLLCAWIPLDEELMELALDCVAENLDARGYEENKETIFRLLSVCGQNRWDWRKQSADFQRNDCALGRLLHTLVCLLAAETEPMRIRNDYRLLQKVSEAFYQAYQEKYTGDIGALLCAEKALAAVGIYPVCSEKNQERIRQFFAGWKADGWEAYEVYGAAVMCGVREPDAAFERIVFENLDRIKKVGKDCVPHPYEEVLTLLYQLYLDKKLIHAKELKEELLHADNPAFRFLGSMDDFDYSKFELEWLCGFGEPILKKIAFHQTARTNITRRLVEENRRGEIDGSIVNLYFRYFVKIE